MNFSRDGYGRLNSDLAHRRTRFIAMKTTYADESAVPRPHAVGSDRFVYSGMPPQDAANNLIQKIKESAQPVLANGQDALVPIILDGENAWEYYPQSGRNSCGDSTTRCRKNREWKR